jgi:hypothetical protein
VLIEGADGLVLEDLRVTCPKLISLVTVRNTVGIDFRGGKIYGGDAQNPNVGLRIGSGVKNLKAVNLTIAETGHGVVFEDTVDASSVAENITFVDSDIEQQLVNMVEVRANSHVYGLNFTAVHTESSEAGCQYHVAVLAGAGVHGGCFAGCEMSSLKSVFQIQGEWEGVNVFGCYTSAQKVDDGTGTKVLAKAADRAVWQIETAAAVSKSCDMFNAWEDIVIQTDENGADLGGPDAPARRIPVFTFADGVVGGSLVVQAPAIRFDVTKLGFFGAEPWDKMAHYYAIPPDGDDRDITTKGAAAVLTTLLWDLSRLGLIRVNR